MTGDGLWINDQLTKYELINMGTGTFSIKPMKVKDVQFFNKPVLLKTLSF